MTTIQINYKDHLGRNNKVTSQGVDKEHAKKKFETLYPDCTIISID